jgi:hypothetical protein
MLGFHPFHAAHDTIVGIELLRMKNKGQRAGPECKALSAAEQFYALDS